MYLSNSSFGGTRKLTAFSPRKVVHHAVFCKYYAELATEIKNVGKPETDIDV
jgi:hypothetical protein